MARLVREIDRLLQVSDDLLRFGEAGVNEAELSQIQSRLRAIRDEVDSGLSVAVVRHSVNSSSARLLECLARRRMSSHGHRVDVAGQQRQNVG
jgi:hypothetical protein